MSWFTSVIQVIGCKLLVIVNSRCGFANMLEWMILNLFLKRWMWQKMNILLQ